jgi:hypothetical protein
LQTQAQIAPQNVTDVRPIIREVFRVEERVNAGQRSSDPFTPQLDVLNLLPNVATPLPAASSTTTQVIINADID